MSDLTEHYDARYRTGRYRDGLSCYEAARVTALRHFIPRVAGLRDPARVLDYGVGNGLHVPLWRELFPLSELHGCDISVAALAQLQEGHARVVVHAMSGHCVDVAAGSFDAVVSIEVMEHVSDLGAYVADVHRVLKPGGAFVWTTPCANVGSIEHLVALWRHEIDPTAEGYRRFRWEDPDHVRRLTGGEVKRVLGAVGFRDLRLRYRAHFFSFLVARYWRLARLPEGVKARLYELDYRVFRWLPNGASMVGVARKPMG